jgi:hypothetical protein
MNSRKLQIEDKDIFYKFLKEQRPLNIEKNRPWFIDDVGYNSSNRQLFGTFDQNELIAVMACNLWNEMPFSTFDSFCVSKKLGYKETRSAVTPIKIQSLDWAEENKKVAHMYIGPYRETKLMTGSKGLWNEALQTKGYIPTELAIVPANTKGTYKFLDIMMRHRTYPVDMLVFMIFKNMKDIPNNWSEIIKL